MSASGGESRGEESPDTTRLQEEPLPKTKPCVIEVVNDADAEDSSRLDSHGEARAPKQPVVARAGSAPLLESKLEKRMSFLQAPTHMNYAESSCNDPNEAMVDSKPASQGCGLACMSHGRGCWYRPLLQSVCGLTGCCSNDQRNSA